MLATKNSVLMCPPTYYEILAKENDFMDLKNPPDKEKTWEQWIAIKNLYTKFGLSVYEMEPVPRFWDMVFTANGGWGKKVSPYEGNEFVLSNFRQPIRQDEKKYFKQALERLGICTFSLPQDIYFEGQADIANLRSIKLFGYGTRSSREALEYVKRLSKSLDQFVMLELAGDEFYHLDTCLMPLRGTDKKAIMYYPGAFTEVAEAKLRKLRITSTEKFEIPESLAREFVCNSVFIGNNLLLNVAFDDYSEESFNLSAQGLPIVNLDEPRYWELVDYDKEYATLIMFLKKLKYNVIPVYTSQFKKSGAGARCLTLFLN